MGGAVSVVGSEGGVVESLGGVVLGSPALPPGVVEVSPVPGACSDSAVAAPVPLAPSLVVPDCPSSRAPQAERSAAAATMGNRMYLFMARSYAQLSLRTVSEAADGPAVRRLSLQFIAYPPSAGTHAP